jgi:hypothetical protein
MYIYKLNLYNCHRFCFYCGGVGIVAGGPCMGPRTSGTRCDFCLQNIARSLCRLRDRERRGRGEGEERLR